MQIQSKGVLVGIFLVCLSILGTLQVMGQDTLIMTNGEVLQVQILKVGEKKVTYQLPGEHGGQVFLENKSEISEIRYGKEGMKTVILDERRKLGAESGKCEFFLKDGRMLNGVLLSLVPAGECRILTGTGDSLSFKTSELDLIRKAESPQKGVISPPVPDPAKTEEPASAPKERRAYLGFTLGPALPILGLGTGSPEYLRPGFQTGYLTLGFDLSPHFGLSARAYSVAFSGADDYGMTHIRGILAGPHLQVPLTPNTNFGLRTMIGTARISLPGWETNELDDLSLAWSLGLTLRVNLSEKWTVLGHADFFQTLDSGSNAAGNKEIFALMPGLGLARRI